MADMGHANNVANFQQYVSIIAGLGASYDPGNADISLVKMQNKLTAMQASFDGWGEAKADEKFVDTGRENLFKSAGETLTKAVNYYGSSGAPENRIADAKEFLRKWRGKRATAPVPDDPATPEDESKNTVSSAQTGYIQRAAHFEGALELFSTDSTYSPNENPLKVTGLTTLSDELKAANTASIDAETDTEASRNNFFAEAYIGPTCALELVRQSKKYLRALLGPSSLVYKQATALKFKKPTGV